MGYDPNGQARWAELVDLAWIGMPVTTSHTDELVVCNRCKQTILMNWLQGGYAYCGDCNWFMWVDEDVWRKGQEREQEEVA